MQTNQKFLAQKSFGLTYLRWVVWSNRNYTALCVHGWIRRSTCVYLLVFLLRISCNSSWVICWVLIFQNHECQTQLVRLRICQLMNRLLDNMGQDATVLEDTYNKIAECMLVRLKVRIWWSFEELFRFIGCSLSWGIVLDKSSDMAT